MVPRLIPLLAAGGLLTAVLFAQDNKPLQPLLLIGGPEFENWTGLEAAANGAMLKVPGKATYKYPAGPRGFYSKEGNVVCSETTTP